MVTGASRGLGFLLARRLANLGHDLVINARSERGLETAADELRRRGVEVAPVSGDVSDETTAQRLVDAARQRHGRLDVLVTNAGVIQVGPASAMRTVDYGCDCSRWSIGCCRASSAARRYSPATPRPPRGGCSAR